MVLVRVVLFDRESKDDELGRWDSNEHPVPRVGEEVYLNENLVEVVGVSHRPEADIPNITVTTRPKYT